MQGSNCARGSRDLIVRGSNCARGSRDLIVQGSNCARRSGDPIVQGSNCASRSRDPIVPASGIQLCLFHLKQIKCLKMNKTRPLVDREKPGMEL